MTKLSNANIEWFTKLSLKEPTWTGWSSGTGTEEPFRCIAGPIPCGCITADSCPGFSAVETGMLATESVSSVLTTPFIRTAVKLRSKIKSSRREHNSFNTKGSFSKDDGDGNENVKRAIGLDWQNNNFVRSSRFFYISFVTAHLRRARFSWGREHKTLTHYFSFPELR